LKAKDDKGQTPLQFAAGFGRMGVVRLLLNTGKVDMNSKDQYGVTPLQWASKHGYRDVVELLESSPLESSNNAIAQSNL
jgi:ankyrin repeat protein